MSFLMHVVAHVSHYVVFYTTLPYLFIHSSQLEFQNLDFFIPCRSLYRKLWFKLNNILKRYSISIQHSIHVCVQWTLLYKSLEGLYTCVCSMNTFIQVLRRTDRSTIVLQCSLNSQNIFLAASRFSAQNRPYRLVPTDPVLGFFSRSSRCWACLSTIFTPLSYMEP